MADKAALLRRIRSLLVMADPRHGATPSERATARRIADCLMAENGWAEADVPEREVSVQRAAPAPRHMSPVVVIVVGGMGGFDINGSTSTGNTFVWGAL